MVRALRDATQPPLAEAAKPHPAPTRRPSEGDCTPVTRLLLLVLAIDGGTFSQPPYDSCPETTEQAVELDGGAWLSPKSRAARQACLLATCEANGAQVEPVPPAPLGVVLGLVTALVVGFAAGVVVAWRH